MKHSSDGWKQLKMLHFLVLKLFKKSVSCLRRADYATAVVDVEDKDIN